MPWKFDRYTGRFQRLVLAPVRDLREDREGVHVGVLPVAVGLYCVDLLPPDFVYPGEVLIPDGCLACTTTTDLPVLIPVLENGERRSVGFGLPAPLYRERVDQVVERGAGVVDQLADVESPAGRQLRLLGEVDDLLTGLCVDPPSRVLGGVVPLSGGL
jgi:hypothetical protein